MRTDLAQQAHDTHSLSMFRSGSDHVRPPRPWADLTQREKQAWSDAVMAILSFKGIDTYSLNTDMAELRAELSAARAARDEWRALFEAMYVVHLRERRDDDR